MITSGSALEKLSQALPSRSLAPTQWACTSEQLSLAENTIWQHKYSGWIQPVLITVMIEIAEFELRENLCVSLSDVMTCGKTGLQQFDHVTATKHGAPRLIKSRFKFHLRKTWAKYFDDVVGNYKYLSKSITKDLRCYTAYTHENLMTVTNTRAIDRWSNVRTRFVRRHKLLYVSPDYPKALVWLVSRCSR